ncbi:thiamine-triphosphatase [Bombina bombina]|uniref:thiamine-triphosphatase n=1 Tax=Bombina bombina TaxID=8345 RepID=UPI00235A7BCA|nr:thiamine-triphosphatase [Bombina bombina]XP_053558300.1 thiamine-triphosphatase [Bombina bombina]
MCSMILPSSSIEVERKFVPGPDVEGRLHDLGAVLLKELVFCDSYYDSPDLLLTTRDLWLRKRDHSWELKHPPKRGTLGLSGASTQYREVNCEAEIISRVSEELGVPCPLSLDSLPLQEFATFVTRRRRFQIPQSGDSRHSVIVDLDMADFGFEVGEVEVLVDTQDEVENALQEVEEICKKMGVLSDSPVPGKMSTFLRLNRTEHYNRLREAHVL